jgi:fido (protein-threonine AMPylation protein)
MRSHDFGSEYLTFGEFRSEQRGRVAKRVDEILREYENRVLEVERGRATGGHAERALSVALRVHAEIVLVHPFQDGNGRVTRALLGVVLVRLGLTPIPVDAPKIEYLDARNVYHRQKNITPLVDLALRLATLAAPLQPPR